MRRGSPSSIVVAQLGRLLGDLRERAVDVGPVEADLRRLALPVRGVGERGHATGDAVEHGGAPLLGVLDVVPVREHLSASRRRVATSPKTCGWRRTSLSWMPVATSAIVNRPSCSAIVAWNSIWYSRSPSSSIRCVVGRRIVGVERLQRVDDLVGLLDQVRDQRLVGLLDVPRALLAQRARQLVEPHVARRRRARPAWGCRCDVRWSASTVRSSSAHVVWTISSSGVPSAWRIVDRLVAGGAVDRQLDVATAPSWRGCGRRAAGRVRRPRRWRTRGRRPAARRPRPGRCRAGRTRRRGTTSPAGRSRTSTRRVAPGGSRTERSSTSGEPGTA